MHSPYYKTFVFKKLKIIVVISESVGLKNGSGNYLNPFFKNTNVVLNFQENMDMKMEISVSE
jgi:hypothetical protein